MPMTPTSTLFRRALLLILLLGMVGMGVELLLLGHTEDLWQWEPLAMLTVGLPVVLAKAVKGTALTRRLCLALMALFVVSGAIGTLLHYQGNVAFELEMIPALGGWDLFREAMSGATPVLAPGAMMQLGLLGLVYTLIPDRQP